MMDSQNIPFKVSARTARLIGRENIATAKGAIIELVKNGYDADSPISIVYFDNYLSVLRESITKSLRDKYIAKGVSEELLDKIYSENNNEYTLTKDLHNTHRKEFKETISRFATLYIIDGGEGMTQKIIRDNWMTIGTDNKEKDFFTKHGRVKSGAKGIGRFALDKLGSKCEMITVFNKDNHVNDIDINGKTTDFVGYNWKVNWEDFEGDFKTIEKVSAELIGLHKCDINSVINNILPNNLSSKIKNKKSFESGTILKISDLRDNWDDYYVEQVYSDLEVLAPPKETNEFEIYLFSSYAPSSYGEVSGSICDDFDFKIVAKADENQNVKIKIIRNEYDVLSIPSEFFLRENMLKKNYLKEDFLKGYWETEKTFSELMPGFKIIDEAKAFEAIGLFEFTFYFMKRTYTGPDASRFFYKPFASNSRKDWLQKFGGIKLFRDNFRVRPYGEVKDVAFDWLSLGNRKAASPAGISNRDGGYKVEPENVAGSIKISRLTNLNFEDKSSREGLQENRVFQIFKSLIASIISEFEKDRAYIAREMASFDDERYSELRSRQQAEDIAKRIFSQNKEKKSHNKSSTQDSQESIKDQELAIIAELNIRKDEEIERLKEEQKVLRGLASSGIVLASFSHDLSKLNNVLESRVDKIKKIILEKINESDYFGIEERKNPFTLLERIKSQDLKIKNWLNFSLGAARKDKRKRKQLFLQKYFKDFKSDWTSVLVSRNITLDISEIEDIDMRVFEIDFDSIFNNLLVNTIDAFNISDNDTRLIKISIKSDHKEISFIYEDNGPGLSSDITTPEEIFKPLFTTKRNMHSGEEEGTGLGMWLVKSITEENDGKVQLLYPDVGFSIRLIFPVKYKR
ncbi:HAMP domain-containing histidine kinase [Pantoea dispersa]|uniref:ATP-binding protein n=1 Tax=Pantoea dispersa TaxID=59814 RepID=UPI0021AE9B46|nr:HAMP domain-containing sensor histidine kinase [Pantoea dispersa]MCT6590823.1 HAMP domain-containing histidine kinase [Pantoea dispersa]